MSKGLKLLPIYEITSFSVRFAKSWNLKKVEFKLCALAEKMVYGLLFLDFIMSQLNWKIVKMTSNSRLTAKNIGILNCKKAFKSFPEFDDALSADYSP